jgi:isoleucyl-tRNA synthetase
LGRSEDSRLYNRHMPDPVFKPLPAVPDHPSLEVEVLELWDREQMFERVREQNRGGPKWSFVDGPVTANKTLGVHTAWGRTLKDVFQRYKALQGFDQRYQNGFDCQGLWIEVGVERQLGLNSKREIEEFGLEEFAHKCREVVVWSANELWRGCKRLGQWMDWGNDYFTFSDTNIEYIWRFLRIVHEKGWLFLGHRSTEWCPRCGTSISAHELAGNYVDRADPSLFVRLPLLDRPGESLVVWTTTPWTLPANVAAAVNPEAEYGRRPSGEWVAAPRYPDESLTDIRPGSELVGWRYEGPFDDLAPGAAVQRGTRSHSTRAQASCTSRQARARRTSSSRACTTCPCSRRSTRPAASTTTTAGSTVSPRSSRRSRSSATWRRRGVSSSRGSTSTAIPSAGAAIRR